MFGAISLAMDRKTLKGIKKRAETTSACSLKPSPLFILLVVLVLPYQLSFFRGPPVQNLWYPDNCSCERKSCIRKYGKTDNPDYET